ncbi:MAG: 6-phosphogluconolactonase [Gammaproteobacteria bacterium]|nr:6-phosphogluconolactonase [Gammaproteobacteria bacterium]
MEHFFDTREEASVAAAARIGQALSRRLEAQGSASLVVSGGTTPARCFEKLSQSDIDWANVGVLPSDERWVPATHDDSNEKLIRESLLVGHAAKAELLGYYAADMSIEERCEEINSEIRFVPFPFACSLLGMGADGHFASLFPDAENLAAGLDLESQTLCLPVATAASPYPRISLTLAALSRSDEIVLLMFGNDKRIVYDKAKAGNARYPLTRLLRQKRAPVHVYWAP